MRRLLKLLYHHREGRDRRYYFDGIKYLGAGYTVKKSFARIQASG